jgi:hypothetical protein
MAANVSEIRFTANPPFTLNNTVNRSVTFDGSYIAIPLKDQHVKAYKVFEAKADGSRGPEKANVFITIVVAADGKTEIALVS